MVARQKLTKYEQLRMIHGANFHGYDKVIKSQIAWLIKLLMVDKGFEKDDAITICKAIIRPHWYSRDSEQVWGQSGYYDTGPCHYENEWLKEATPYQIRHRFIKPKIIRLERVRNR